MDRAKPFTEDISQSIRVLRYGEFSGHRTAQASFIVRSEAGPAPAVAGSQHLAKVMRRLLPMIEHFKIAARSGVDIETLVM